MGKNTVVVEQGYWERDPETGEEEEWRGCIYCWQPEGTEHASYCPLHSNNGERAWQLENVRFSDNSGQYRHPEVGGGSWEYEDKNDPRNDR